MYYTKQMFGIALTYGHFGTLLNFGSRLHYVICDIAHYLCAAVEVAEHMVA
jgi:hypothetical protein